MSRTLSVIFATTIMLAAGCSSAPVAECDSDCFDQQRRAQYVNDHPNTPSHIVKAIMEGRAMVGMSKPEVIAAIGPPAAAVDTNSAWFAREQWVYSSITSRDTYFFKFGKLTGWNSSSYLSQEGAEP